MNPNVFMFFKEFFQRLFIKSPLFFRIFQIVTASLSFAGYVPAMLQRWFGVEVPGHIIHLCEDIAKYATGFFLSAALTAETKPVAVMEDGRILKKTDEEKLPFTKRHEDKEKEKLTEVPKVAEVVDIKEGEESFAPPKKDEE